MIIAAYLPLSLCDYPGKIASAVFTQGCNFRCSWCHNQHLLPAESETQVVEIAWVLKEIGERRRKGQIEGVVVSGGEPTIHRGLLDFLAACKAAELAVKLDTNGSNPDVVRECLQRELVDFIAMDIKAPWAKYDVLAGVKTETDALRESVRLIASSGISHQFRTTRVDAMLTDEDCAVISAQIPDGSPHVWQAYRPV